MPGIVRERWQQHWSRERLLLVILGIACFYVIYVSYRNLKSFLPLVSDRMYDRELHMLDRVLFFGHDPALVLHDILGDQRRGRTCSRASTCSSSRWSRSW